MRRSKYNRKKINSYRQERVIPLERTSRISTTVETSTLCDTGSLTLPNQEEYSNLNVCFPSTEKQTNDKEVPDSRQGNHPVDDHNDMNISIIIPDYESTKIYETDQSEDRKATSVR